MNKEKVIIVGAGGFGNELFALLQEAGKYEVLGFVDSRRYQPVLKHLWLGEDKDLESIRTLSACAFIAVGDLPARKRLHFLLLDKNYSLPVFVHSRAYVAENVQIDKGSIIYPHVTIHRNVILGRGVLVNSNVTIGHDTVCGDFTTLNPNSAVAGKVKIGNQVHIGIGSSIIEGLHICDRSVVGAGAVVVANLEEPGTYVGVPAKRLR